MESFKCPEVQELFSLLKSDKMPVDEVNQVFDVDYIIDILRSLEARIDIVEKKVFN